MAENNNKKLNKIAKEMIDEEFVKKVDDTSQQLAETEQKKADKVIVNDFRDETGFALEALRIKIEGYEPPEEVVNLWDNSVAEFGTLSETSGNVSTHASNRTSPFIPIKPSTPYSVFSPDSTFKIVFYTDSQSFISGQGWTSHNEHHVITTPPNASFARVTVQHLGAETIVFNEGSQLWPVEKPGFWDEIPRPPLAQESVKSHHIETGAVTPDKLTTDIRKIVSPERITIKNLWDVNKSVLGTLSESSGNVNSHESNRTSDFIEIFAGKPYTFKVTSLFKVVFYDRNKAVVKGYGWQTAGVATITAPDNAKYMRFTLQHLDHGSATVNIGTVPVTSEIEGESYLDTYWDTVPDNSVHLRHLSKDITSRFATVRKEKPFPNRLTFEELSIGWNEINHLSRNGEVIYFKRGRVVSQSTDEGNTIVDVCTLPSEIPSVQAIRDMDDGELLISTTRNDELAVNSKVYKTIGYDPKNPGNTQYKEVLTAVATQANIYSSWGLEAHSNIVLASEYGLRGDEGARRVYLSTDFGETWSVIFDQKTTTPAISGAPTWTDSAHVHTVHYDRYFERIWVVCGDSPNTATYYSDDYGATWTFVPGSTEVQYTGIVSFPRGVVFGSDRSPNGLHVWRRTERKSDPVKIETLMTINDETVITHVFQRAFRRYANKGEVALFPATRVDAFAGVYNSVLMGFTDIDNPVKLYELDYNGLGMYVAIGETAKGNILTSYQSTQGHHILRAKAPLWE